MVELLPCPFCGAGETLIQPEKYWTGKSFPVLSVTVRHWCPRKEGDLQTILLVKRKTQELAIKAWNTRVPTVREGE